MCSALPVDPSTLYLTHRALIDRTIASVCRRSHVSRADADDFASATHLHLIDQDYAVLRAYQGRADIAGFLHAVIRRLFQDWRNANWGRWRPSACARRQGAVAMLLETLLVRDRRPLHEAIDVLRTNHGVTESSETLEAMAASFPPRAMRTFVTADVLADRAADEMDEAGSAAARVDRQEVEASADRVSAALDDVLAALPVQDQVILRMRFENGAAISTISRVLGLEQQPLYRRVERLLAGLRAALEHRGVDAAEVRDVIHRRGFELVETRSS